MSITLPSWPGSHRDTWVASVAPGPVDLFHPFPSSNWYSFFLHHHSPHFQWESHLQYVEGERGRSSVAGMNAVGPGWVAQSKQVGAASWDM